MNTIDVGLLILGILSLIGSIIVLILALRDARLTKTYREDCDGSTKGEIINYRTIKNTDTNDVITQVPIYKYTVDGIEYKCENGRGEPRMIKKNITVRYCKSNPKISYIEELGLPLGATKLLLIISIIFLLLSGVFFIFV